MPQVTIELSETNLQLAQFLTQVLHQRLWALYESDVAVDPADTGDGT